MKYVVLFHGMSNTGEETRHESNDDELGLRKSGGDVLSASEDKAKVISKGAARLIVSGGEQASAEKREPQEIIHEPRPLASAKAGPILESYDQPEEDVLRLERSVDPGKERVKVSKAKFVKRETQPDEAEKQEAQWGEKSVSGGRMLLLGGLVVVVFVVSLVAVRSLFDGDAVKIEILAPPIVEEDRLALYEGSPEKWFHERSGRISAEALEILNSFLGASDNTSRSEWVRHPAKFLKHVQTWPVKIDPLIEPRDLQSWDIGHTGDTAYLILTARNREYLPFRAYFTREGGELKLDWHATVAWSDVSLQSISESAEQRAESPNAHLPDTRSTDSVLVRCMLRKRNEFYAGPYNDQDHSAFMLLSADKMHQMWGYAPKGSKLDLQLRAILDHGSFVVSLKKDERVTLCVRVNGKDALPSQLDMVELVNREWVTPD